MKKVLFILFGIISFFSFVFAASEQTMILFEKLSAVIEKTLDKYPIEYQLTKYQSLEKILFGFYNKTNDSEKKALAEMLLSFVKQKENDLGVEVQQNNGINSDVYTLPGVNLQEIRKYWLDLHNNLRQKRGKQAYKRNTKLEKTARDWSLYQANLGKWTHARKSSDGFYNYWSIKDWFAKEGVTFDYPGTSFSESICYNYVNCKPGQDCTAQIKNILKQCFDMYVSEYSKYGDSCFGKNYGCAHFRAIVHDYFTDIGMGLATKDGKKYYITTHYGVGVK